MHNLPTDYKEMNGMLFPQTDGSIPEFTYTDGADFELEIERIIARAQDRSLFSRELTGAIWDWRSACHLSPVRANILRPLEALCRGRVLELGSGCGIITRYLGELGGDVVALEASAHRASITRQRTADLKNVSVVCDRIEDFNAEQKFDVVTMIGVLQYARIFSHCGDRAELDLLQNAARQLKDDGVLVIAIQNKLGLKYFSGFPEPNVDVPYYGIEGQYGPDTIIRFGLDELKGILGSVGLSAQEVLFPLPDYHMPVSLLSSKGMDPKGPFGARAFLSGTVGRDRARPDWIIPSFSLEQVWESIHENGLAEDLANSFLIIAGKTPKAVEPVREAPDLAWHYSVERHPAFATAKRFFLQDGTVHTARHRVAQAEAPAVPVSHTIEDGPYLNGPVWWLGLCKILNTPGWSVADVCEWARPWIDALCREANLGAAVSLSLDKSVPGALFDWTPLNCIETAPGELTFFDKEWTIESELSLSYVILRGLFGSMASVASVARPAEGTPLHILELLREALRMQSIGITDHHIESYIAQESSVQHWINGGVEGRIGEPWVAYVKTAKLLVRVDSRHMRALLEQAEGHDVSQQQVLQAQAAEIAALRGTVEQYQSRALAEAGSRWTRAYRALFSKSS
ncbi:methyltransferase [Achromobacter seleniivolatilans]|uniref:Methyltransferase n=1 Tax=Achromobacter seleniivolatilans TaxID=3047478 RepID=A0ABY9LX74_9BURK|nr:methyltransferase [Achromobacter sp. R39]WMD19371.1 methyltransferase [Achromobacter sp. R39]